MIDFGKYLKHVMFIRSPYLAASIFKGYFNRLVLREPVLRNVQIAVTYRCNADCEMCFAKGLSKQRKELSVESISRIRREVGKLGTIQINLTGGEPLLREDILDVIRALQPKKTIVSLTTNSILLTEQKIKDLKRAGLNTLQVSLDSVDSEEHDSIRGYPSAYSKAMQTVDNCKKHNLNVCLSSILYKGGIGKLNKIARLASKKKVFLYVNFAGCVGGWRGKESKSLDDFKVVDEVLSSKNVRNHSQFNFSLKSECPAALEKIYITAYGDVFPCAKIQDSYGNIFQERIEDIWIRMRSSGDFSLGSKYCRLIKDEKSVS